MAVYYTNRAKAYQLINNPELAIEDSERALEIEEHNIKAHYIIGECLCNKGKQNNDA